MVQSCRPINVRKVAGFYFYTLEELQPSCTAQECCSQWVTLRICFPFSFFLFLIDFGERVKGGERNMDLLSHLLMRSLADSSVCPDQGGIEPETLLYRDDAPTN